MKELPQRWLRDIEAWSVEAGERAARCSSARTSGLWRPPHSRPLLSRGHPSLKVQINRIVAAPRLKRCESREQRELLSLSRRCSTDEPQIMPCGARSVNIAIGAASEFIHTCSTTVWRIVRRRRSATGCFHPEHSPCSLCGRAPPPITHLARDLSPAELAEAQRLWGVWVRSSARLW